MIETRVAISKADEAVESRPGRSQIGSLLAYCQRNPHLVAGATIVMALLLIGVVGPLFVDVRKADPLSAIPDLAPGPDAPLGSDDQGRDLLAVLIRGVPLTLRVGFLAGGVGLAIGVVLGMLAGYRGGVIDAIIRTAVDTLLTVPALLILVTVAASIKGFISVDLMALIIASLAWRHPTRNIRAQVLSLRQRGYVELARLSGMQTPKIVAVELLPNLMPYVAASCVGAVAYAILASIGLEALGLGPQNDPTIGMTIYWAIHFNALLRGMWWWVLPPIAVVVLLFIGLFLLTAGLDEVANPRIRRQA